MRVTLARMADGGIHDQLGGGFCRYSVDGEWTIPHFEKMLYDNGPLLGLYADFARVTGDASVRRRRARHRRLADARDARARRRVLLEPRRRQRGRGGQVLRLDARRGPRASCPPTNSRSPRRTAASTAPPNFEGHAWNLRVARAARGHRGPRAAMPLTKRATCSARANATLFAARAKRVRPGHGRQDPDVVECARDRGPRAGCARARRAARGPISRWRRPMRCAPPPGATAACSRRARTARAHLNAYLDDHAFLLDALLELMQTRFRREDFAWARELADAAARAVRGSRQRRLLFHEPRPRAPLPSHASPDPTMRRPRATASPRRR